MRVLLDENLPHQLRHDLPGHEVDTVAYMGWGGIENGQLFELAAHSSFDALLTNDRGLEYEHNLASLPLAVVVVCAKANTVEAIRPLLPELLVALGRLGPREFVKLAAP